MILLVHSETNGGTLEQRLGRSEYSYYFVRKIFRPLLERLGEVVDVEDPETEVDPIWEQAGRRGDRAVFLCFAPPHKLPVGLRCPILPVFAWEFDTLPNENWLDEPRNDWVSVLRGVEQAIVHSAYTVGSVKNTLGEEYDVTSIPAPVWNRYAAMREQAEQVTPGLGRTALSITTPYVDSRTLVTGDYDRFGTERERMIGTARILTAQPLPYETILDGVIYTSVLNPFDGRKRCFDMILNFVWAFRERPDATLVLKITQADVGKVMSALIGQLIRMEPFRCRVLMIQGLLPQAMYDAIVRATTYVVNCSAGEGQCLPLMEFMSCGKPAVAPRNTALLDYVTPDNAFIVEDHPEPTVWPHDRRGMFRALRRRMDFSSLIRAFEDSFVVARTEPARYAAMSAAAVASLEAHCSDAVTLERLEGVLARGAANSAAAMPMEVQRVT